MGNYFSVPSGIRKNNKFLERVQLKAEKRCKSILPELDPALAETLDSVDKVCLDVLLPSVCRGDLIAVRAVLDTADAVGTAKRCANFVCPVSGRSVLFYATLRQRVAIVEELLKWGADPSWRWHETIPMKFGVPEVELIFGVWLDCLCLAVHERHADVARLLVGAGADVTMNTWNTLHSLHEIGSHLSPSNFDMLLILHDSGKNRVPIAMAGLAWIKSRRDNALTLFSCEGSVCWRFTSYVSVQQTMDSMVPDPRTRFFLHQQARTRHERICKAVCLQMTLVRLCLQWNHIQEPASLLSLLLEEGASIHGWTWKRASAMMRAWRQLAAMSESGTETHRSDVSWQLAASKRSICTVVSEDGRQTVHLCRLLHRYHSCEHYMEWLKPCASICPLTEAIGEWHRCKQSPAHQCINGPCDLSPFSRLCILPAVLCRNYFHATEEMAVLFRQSKVAWLDYDVQTSEVSLQDQARRLLQRLHDGPSCYRHGHVTKEQSRVSLAMLTCSGGVLQSLQSVCRDVILTACMTSSTDLLSCIDQLPLPPSVREYLLPG